VLIPALNDVMPSWGSNIFALSAKHYQELNRKPNGQFDFGGVYVDKRFLEPLGAEIKRIISMSADEQLHRFRDAFFITHGHGLKAPVDDLDGFRQAFELDFEMDLVLASPSLFVDVGMEQTFSIPASVAPTTALWKAADTTAPIKHLTLLKSLFYDDEAGDLPIYKSYYRLDPFMNFSSLAGFSYRPPCPSSPRAFGVSSIKAYPTFKHQHYHRQGTGSRHTKTLSAIDLWEFGDKAQSFNVSVQRSITNI
jgi:hypothetical protein